MTLFIFKYALPALLGYTLFVGISGNFNPLRKPALLGERPSWMLGLWTGLSIFLVLSVGLFMAYEMSLEAARSLATPSAVSIMLLLGLGFIGYSRYRAAIFTEIESLDQRVDNNDEPRIDWSEKIQQLDPIIESHNENHTESQTPALAITSETSSVAILQNELAKEREVRQETERHLRITRKALSVSSMDSMKQELSEPQKAPMGNSNFSHHTLNHQTTQRSSTNNTLFSQDDFELTVANLKRELVKAKQEVRLHVAARAKALSTANKSVAFARQSIELRARLETELDVAHSALANRQTTITSLISRLERERRLTDDELAALAHNVAVNDPTTRADVSSQSRMAERAQNNARFTSGS